MTKQKSRHQSNQTVSLILNPDDSWGRGITEGVAEYAYHRARWRLRIIPIEDIRQLSPKSQWLGQGAIAHIQSQQMARSLLALGIPVVDIETVALDHTHKKLAHVITNDLKRARLAFSHFKERGISHLACFRPPSQRYSDLRNHKFTELVEEAGLPCDNFCYRSRKKWWTLTIEDQQKIILPWLKSLPTGTGMFAPDAHQARQLTEVCQFNQIRIPEEIALIAGDLDELLCSVSHPRLTGILLASQRHGFEAARTLHRMMQGRRSPIDPILIDPLQVVPQASTDLLYLDDPLIVQAIYYIREQACTGIDVSDVLKQVPISRRVLEMKFKISIGLTPAQEIRRVKLNHAQNLLITSGKTIESIAYESGFSNTTQFCVTFRKQVGLTPLSYRRQARNE